MDRATKIILSAALVTALCITYAHGGVNGYTIWNIFPLPFALLTLLVDKRERGIRFGIYSFSSSVVFLVFIVHSGYIIDFRGMSSDPVSTHLTFVKLPFLAIGAGYIAAMAGVVIGLWGEVRTKPSAGK